MLDTVERKGAILYQFDVTGHSPKGVRIMAKSKAEWLEALKAYCDAAQRVSELWPDGNVNDYPAYLPSFDEHVQDLRDFLEANTKKAIRTVAQFGDE